MRILKRWQAACRFRAYQPFTVRGNKKQGFSKTPGGGSDAAQVDTGGWEIFVFLETLLTTHFLTGGVRRVSNCYHANQNKAGRQGDGAELLQPTRDGSREVTKRGPQRGALSLTKLFTERRRGAALPASCSHPAGYGQWDRARARLGKATAWKIKLGHIIKHLYFFFNYTYYPILALVTWTLEHLLTSPDLDLVLWCRVPVLKKIPPFLGRKWRTRTHCPEPEFPQTSAVTLS